MVPEVQLDLGRDTKAVRDNGVQAGTVCGCELTTVQLPAAFPHILQMPGYHQQGLMAALGCTGVTLDRMVTRHYNRLACHSRYDCMAALMAA